MTGSPPVVFPPGRYGRRRTPHRRRRWVTGLVAGLVVLAGLGISLRLYVQYGRPAFSPRVVSVTPDGEDAVLVIFEVAKRGTGPAVCRLRALTYDVEEIAAVDVAVPAGRRVTVAHRLVTTERPYTVQVSSCHAPR